ncbi:hypothetical protein [Paraburkholderia fungorum]|uniref:hypothetical protein n=1 Tax=Paraburkholderia fungorum TaxID=134537 RepID=UPI0033134ACA
MFIDASRAVAGGLAAVARLRLRRSGKQPGADPLSQGPSAVLQTSGKTADCDTKLVEIAPRVTGLVEIHEPIDTTPVETEIGREGPPCLVQRAIFAILGMVATLVV